MNKPGIWVKTFMLLFALILTACGGGGSSDKTVVNTYTIGGNISVLVGSGLVLQNNAGDDLTIVANATSFTFGRALADSASYSVSVFTQPGSPNQVCSVTDGSGTVSGANISNVAISCVTSSYTISGTVSGLAGSGLLLQNNVGDDLIVSANGNFSFTGAITDGNDYSVSVLSQPGSPNQVCSVTNGSGTVTGANIANVDVSCVTSTYTLGGTVSGLEGSGLILQNNGTDDLVISANGGFTFASVYADGIVYSITVAIQPGSPVQACGVTNGNGTLAGVSINNISVSCPPVVSAAYPRFAYVPNRGNNSVSYYAVENDTGRLRYQGNVDTGDGPIAITLDPSESYAYVTNFIDDNISQYGIGTDGVLTAMTPATVAAGELPQSVSIDPWGNYAYVANRVSDNISQYNIGANGALTAMAPAVVATGDAPVFVTIDPSGRYVYVVNNYDDNVSQYRIDTDGTLTAMTPATVATGDGPGSITVDPSGRYAYVTSISDDIISQYSIGTDGALTAMLNPTVTAGDDPLSVITDISGSYAYVSNYGDATVSQYNIGADGALTAMIPANVPSGDGSRTVTVDPSGSYVYVANASDNSVSQFSIGADGALIPVAPANIAARLNPYAVVVTGGVAPVSAVAQYAYVANGGDYTLSQYTFATDGSLIGMVAATVAVGYDPESIAVDPTGSYVYVATDTLFGTSQYIAQYLIGADGALTAMTPATIVVGDGSKSVTVDPSGSYVYVANSDDNTISQYSIGTNGTLAAMTPATVAAGSGFWSPWSVTVDASGSYAYAANSDNTVSQFRITNDGALVALTPATVAAGNLSRSVTVDPSGSYAYVANGGDNSVSQYTIGADGKLTAMAIPVVAAGDGPWSVTVDASGSYVYVANNGDNTISQYSIGSDGALTHLSAAIAAGQSPRSITTDISGSYVYVSNYNDGNVSQYRIGATGILTAMTPATVSSRTFPNSIVTTGHFE
ncbi:MAG: beta-propeller fold lactonase family protein [Gammaproteobacteria bacterium]|jgi:6-phosphogluconolactonase (cycloisomerase 2 family)|nr:beta-propeller fold lactonase family protein [Gammaproteobacteria bacterium]MBT3725599.1 beta-propeller fold lactonase family protein [Gammaproteobacteria bacterium]MBT4078636.1 beta-propeller fold lactonase family protein [Gammaproteobacteria bacterium]MBT4196951.1 beta-propeller fold lactonase family protein [Gammaproteobacteria bacterium]MBT4449525.1 beta-propeller fold lactonase family protein [Gammaproteobacteria bacterium]